MFSRRSGTRLRLLGLNDGFDGPDVKGYPTLHLIRETWHPGLRLDHTTVISKSRRTDFRI